MSEWKSLPIDEPTNGESVYTRVRYYYGLPFSATWNSSTKEFTDDVNGIVYPAWSVARWKSK